MYQQVRVSASSPPYTDTKCLGFMRAGVTPQRREFGYPSQLSKTREHKELLEEFRSNMANTNTLPRLPESDSEWEGSTTDVSCD